MRKWISVYLLFFLLPSCVFILCNQSVTVKEKGYDGEQNRRKAHFCSHAKCLFLSSLCTCVCILMHLSLPVPVWVCAGNRLMKLKSRDDECYWMMDGVGLSAGSLHKTKPTCFCCISGCCLSVSMILSLVSVHKCIMWFCVTCSETESECLLTNTDGLKQWSVCFVLFSKYKKICKANWATRDNYLLKPITSINFTDNQFRILYVCVFFG